MSFGLFVEQKGRESRGQKYPGGVFDFFDEVSVVRRWRQNTSVTCLADLSYCAHGRFLSLYSQHFHLRTIIGITFFSFCKSLFREQSFNCLFARQEVHMSKASEVARQSDFLLCSLKKGNLRRKPSPVGTFSSFESRKKTTI